MFWIFALLTFIETSELHRKVWCRTFQAKTWKMIFDTGFNFCTTDQNADYCWRMTITTMLTLETDALNGDWKRSLVSHRLLLVCEMRTTIQYQQDHHNIQEESTNLCLVHATEVKNLTCSTTKTKRKGKKPNLRRWIRRSTEKGRHYKSILTGSVWKMDQWTDSCQAKGKDEELWNI